jgi:hypothetical protein
VYVSWALDCKESRANKAMKIVFSDIETNIRIVIDLVDESLLRSSLLCSPKCNVGEAAAAHLAQPSYSQAPSPKFPGQQAQQAIKPPTHVIAILQTVHLKA